MSSVVTPLSLRAYARHRGCSLKAVQNAIASGRLSASLTADGQVADPELADHEWDANTDHSRAPDYVKARAAGAAAETTSFLEPQPHGGALKRTVADDTPPGESLAGASAQEKHWRAKLAELKYRERAGELVEAAAIEAAFAERITLCRTRLMGLPSKAKQLLPHLTLDDVEVLEGVVREALEGLAVASPARTEDVAGGAAT